MSFISQLPMLTVERLSVDQVNLIEKRMKPKQWSTVDFLTEQQSLVEVANEDRRTLNDRAISYEQIADKLESLIEKCKLISKPGHLPLVEGKFLIQKRQTKGFQECPFTRSDDRLNDCGQHQGSADFCVINTDTNESFKFASLMPHLIRDHHFFQGGGYRVDPEKAISFFDLQKEVSYQPKKEEVLFWEDDYLYFLCGIEEEDVKYAKRVSSEHKILAEGIEAYVINGSDIANVMDLSKEPKHSNKRLLRDLDSSNNYLYVVCQKGASAKNVKTVIGGHLLDKDLIMSGSQLFRGNKKVDVVLDSNDTAALVEKVVFNAKGEAIKVGCF